MVFLFAADEHLSSLLLARALVLPQNIFPIWVWGRQALPLFVSIPGRAAFFWRGGRASMAVVVKE